MTCVACLGPLEPDNFGLLCAPCLRAAGALLALTWCVVVAALVFGGR